MPTHPYFLKNGTRVPGTTTVIGNCHLGSIDGLLGWANQLGKEGRNHREVRDAAADAGTACHEMAECYAKQIPFESSKYKPESLAKAVPAFAAFKEWADQTNLVILHSEMPLVSELYKYGGTLDAMLVNNRLSLGDYKTSNSLQPGMLCQLAAYKNLWAENRPDEVIDGGFHLLRFSRPDHPDDPVRFAHYFWSDLDLAWEAFKHMRELYTIHARLKKLI